MERISLFNYEFDNSYIGTRFFSTIQERNNYFNIPNCFNNKKPINFNFENLDKASCYIREDSEDFRELLESNYLLVESDRNGKKEYYFYFITETKADSSHQIKLMLELDILQTHLLKIKFEKCLIEKAHINRFKWVSSDLLDFNITKNSNSYNPIFSNENVENYEKMFMKEVDNLSGNNLNNFEKDSLENVKCWVYVYIGVYSFDNGNEKNINTFFKYYQNNQWKTGYTKLSSLKVLELEDNYNCGYAIMCFPIYKTTDSSKFFKAKIYYGSESLEQLYTLDSKAFNTIINAGSVSIEGDWKPFNYSHILGVKISKIPPYVPNELYDSSLKEIRSEFGNAPHFFISPIETHSGNYGAFFTYRNNSNYTLESNINLLPSNFSASDIKSNKYLYEPKLYSSYFRRGFLSMGYANGIDLDILQLGKNSKFIINQSLQPDSVGTFIKFSETNKPFNNDEINGNCSLNTYANLPCANSQYLQFLANNNNYYNNANLTLGTKLSMGGITSIVAGLGLVAGISSFIPSLMLGAGASLLGGIGNMVNASAEYSKSMSTLNAKKNAPVDFENGCGNLFGMYHASRDFKPRIEVYECDESIIKHYGDYFNEFGYSLLINDNPIYYFKGRKYFNFIQCNLKGIYSNEYIDNNTRKKLRAIFSNGIKLYHCSISEVGDNNYEDYL